MARMISSAAKKPPPKVRVVRKTLADGTVKEYRYEEKAPVAEPEKGLLWLIKAYLMSPEYSVLTPKTKIDYSRYIERIDAKLGWMGLSDLEDRRCRQEFYAWRDSMKAHPTACDHAGGVLQTIIGWGYQRGYLAYNHSVKIDSLVSATKSRANITWEMSQIEELQKRTPTAIGRAILLAYYTAARQGDLCKMRWDMIDKDGWLVYTPSKTSKTTGLQLHIPTFRLRPLQDILASIPRVSDFILTTPSGIKWRPLYMSSQVSVAIKSHLPESGLHFHDLRGTAITSLFDAGCTESEVAAISGHAVAGIGAMRCYVRLTRERALNAFTKWDTATTNVFPIGLEQKKVKG